MIVLLNVVLPVILAFILYFAYKNKSWKILAIAPLLVVIYGFVQPSYMPKGTVKALPNPEFHASSKQITDRVAKPVSAEDRDAKMKEEFKKSDERREEFVNKLKKEKE